MAKSTSNVFDRRKKMKVATVSGLETKLNAMQRGTIHYNNCLLAFNTNQVI